MDSRPIVIAGPCSAENDEQIDIAIAEAKKRNVTFMRTNLWKPRDFPAWDGLKEKGLYLLGKVADAGVNPALEVMFPDHVTMAMDATLPHLKEGGKLLVWLGARNQNHFLQRAIAAEAAKDERVVLMIKNQCWPNDKHWKGIVAHVLDVGFPKERLLNCYRGAAPSKSDHNPHGFRNMVDFDTVREIKETTDLPMLFDPSHTGGTVENVFRMAELAAPHNFDGLIIEVHHNPEHAMTDNKQQLTWPQFDEFMEKMYPQ